MRRAIKGSKKTYKDIIESAVVISHVGGQGVDIGAGVIGLAVIARAQSREGVVGSLAALLRHGDGGIGKGRRRVLDGTIASGQSEAIRVHDGVVRTLSRAVKSPGGDVGVKVALLANRGGVGASGGGDHRLKLRSQSLVRQSNMGVGESSIRVHHGKLVAVGILLALAADGRAGEAVLLAAGALEGQSAWDNESQREQGILTSSGEEPLLGGLTFSIGASAMKL